MKKIRVLEVLDCFYPSIDGPILCLTHYCNKLNESGKAEAEALVPWYPKYKDNQSFKVTRSFAIKGVEGYRTPLPMFDIKLRKFFKENKFDIIHVHSPFTLGRYALKMAKKYNIPSVLTVHTKYKADFDRKLKTKLMRNFMMNYMLKTMRMADVVTTVSDGARDTFKEYGFEGPVELIRNGTDMKYPENAPELIEKVNKLYNIKKDEVVFVFVGRVVSNKNIDLSIDALKIIKNKGYDFKFLIVGEGSHTDNLKKKVKEYGLEKNVIFTGRINDRELLAAHYLRGDLFLFPSIFDTFGLVALESATMKVPSLMIRGTAAAEVITEEVDGLLAENTAESMAEQIERVFKEKEFISDMKEKAYQNLYKSWETIVKQVYDRYIELIKEKKK